MRIFIFRRVIHTIYRRYVEIFYLLRQYQVSVPGLVRREILVMYAVPHHRIAIVREPCGKLARALSVIDVVP